ncbi:carbohydrate ABC transporter permease [Oceanispirochaeta sp. M1]|nr:carbohydrate ABC transporter permease [Oceanispirochaeta sp. M1]
MKNSSDMIFSILKKIKIYSLNIIIWMFSLSCIFPVIWLMYSSLKTSSEFNRDIISFPKAMQFTNYSRAFLSADLGRLSMNSAFNAIISMSLAVLIAFTIAYLLARFPFKGNRIIYFLFLFGMLVPMHALLVPIFVQFKAMGLFNKRITLILPYVVFNLPFSLFLIESYIRGIPKDLDEAAFMEGCGTVRTMFSIIFPITKPVIVAVGLLAFISSWNEYPFALILINSQKLKTIPLGLVSFKGEYSTDYPLQMAGIVISTIPVIAI